MEENAGMPSEDVEGGGLLVYGGSLGRIVGQKC